jgi:AcrR family transcriptional regulator
MRNVILDTTMKLIYTKGYDQMTIQDILDALEMSKGAFYHYFSSKLAVLEALMDRVFDEMERLLLPIVRDPELPALAKLQRFFAAGVQWKTARKDYLFDLARVIYTDENVLYRQRMRARSIAMCAPMLGAIIRQGIQEGVMNTAYPDLAGEMVMALLVDMGESMMPKVVASVRRHNGSVALSHEVATQIGRICAAYADGLERILGAPSGSVTLVNAETLREWEGLPSNTS